MGEISKQLLIKNKENNGISVKTVLQYVSVAVLSGLVVFALCYFLYPLLPDTKNQPDVKYADLFPVSDDTAIDGTTNMSTSPFVLNPVETCAVQNDSDDAVGLLLVVSSPLHNFRLRKSIRKMWGLDAEQRLLMPNRLMFVVGMSKNDSENEELRDEFEHHSDILQVNVDDENPNPAPKSILMLGWMAMWCPEAANYLKIEDNDFDKVYNFAGFLEREIERKRKKDGKKHSSKKHKPKKNAEQKVYQTNTEYMKKEYPPHVSAATLATTNAFETSGLYHVNGQKEPLLSRDEAFLTALCVNRIKAQRNQQQQLKRVFPPFFGMPMNIMKPQSSLEMWLTMMRNNPNLKGKGFVVTTVHH